MSIIAPSAAIVRRRMWLVYSVSVILCAAAMAVGQDAPPLPQTSEPTIPEPVDSYMGRRIADTMHYSGAEWLIRDEREREERCSLLLPNLGLRRGMTVADIGAGTGYHSWRMAEKVAPQGTVYAVDIQPEMLSLLATNMARRGLTNVVGIHGTTTDPKLPAQSLDLVLLVDVYHEFDHPYEMLKAIVASLKPGGRVAFVEFRGEQASVPIKPLHKMGSVRQPGKRIVGRLMLQLLLGKLFFGDVLKLKDQIVRRFAGLPGDRSTPRCPYC